MKALHFACLAAFLSAPIAAQSFQLTPEMQQLEGVIESMGTKVLWSNNHSSCKSKGHTLLGYFAPRWNHIVMCDVNRTSRSASELIDTLKHEGWHAAQFKCSRNNQVLSDPQIRQGLTRKDRQLIRELYPANQHRSEAEARAVAKLPTPVFLRGFKKVCGLS